MINRHIRYGEKRGQVGDLSHPRHANGPLPVIVLIHGGFWRARFTKVILHPLAHALVEEGFAVWNIEYRRVGRGGGGGGFPATLDDVAAAIDHLGEVEKFERGPVVTCGHSAGGHLALWAAARARIGPGAPGGPPRVPLAGAISLCGAVDLDAGLAEGIGNGAVRGFLGGPDATIDDRLELAAPMRHLPTGIPQILIHGLDDPVVPSDHSRRYVERATAAGDDATFIGLPGVGHGEVIHPHAATFPGILGAIRQLTTVEVR